MARNDSRGYGQGWIATILFLFFFVLYRVFLTQRQKFELRGVVVLVVAVFIAWFAWDFARRAFEKKKQRIRDDEAESLIHQLMEQAQSGKTNPFYLYLRPFAATGKVKVITGRDGTRPNTAEEFIVGVDFLDLEFVLARTVAPIPLVALGKPGEHVGAGRIETSEAEWRLRAVVCEYLGAGDFA